MVWYCVVRRGEVECGIVWWGLVCGMVKNGVFFMPLIYLGYGEENNGEVW